LHFRKNEKICFDLLKQYFNVAHNYHLYKVSDGIGKNYSVDIFIEVNSPDCRGIAIEYQGRQHYSPVNWGKISEQLARNNFDKQRASDKNKRIYCANNKIEYIEIDGRKYFGKKLKKYLCNVIVPDVNQIILQKNTSDFCGQANIIIR
jgi:hypothetical protein